MSSPISASINGISSVAAAILGPLGFVLQDSGSGLWFIEVDNNGILSSVSVISGTPTTPILNDPSGATSWQIGITTGGLLTTTSVTLGSHPKGTTLVSPDGTTSWQLGVTAGGLLTTTLMSFVSAAITGTATVSATMSAKGAVSAVIVGTAAVVATLGATGSRSAAITGTSVVVCSLASNVSSISAHILGTSQVLAASNGSLYIGWAPNWYEGQQNAGLGVYIAPGSINRVLAFNGGVAFVPPNSTTYIWANPFGGILQGPSMPAGAYGIAIVTSGQVLVGGNLPAGLKGPLGQWGGLSFNDGILNVTDIRVI